MLFLAFWPVPIEASICTDRTFSGGICPRLALYHTCTTPGSVAQCQRADIESAQAGLQRELQGTGFSTLREYDTIPYIALELPP